LKSTRTKARFPEKSIASGVIIVAAKIKKSREVTDVHI
jgi:hypothetical protein